MILGKPILYKHLIGIQTLELKEAMLYRDDVVAAQLAREICRSWNKLKLATQQQDLGSC